MRFTTLLLPVYVVGVAAPMSNLAAQVVRLEAESGSLNGFSIVQGGQFSGGARVDGDVSNPTATYTFTGWDGVYDVSVRYCDEDDGVSSYQLTGSSAGSIASWDGDIMTGSNICGGGGLILREVTTSVVLEEGETITFTCMRDPLEPCRTDYFDFAYVPPEPPASSQPAFPEAMGFGAGATGARGFGAEVCVVTSLGDSGPGSFRTCAEQGPPSYITFAVSGYIDLSDEVDIAANKTIECAAAPGDGVVFRKSRLHVTRDNVILRGCRTWTGDEPGGQPLGVRDGIVVGNDITNEVVHDVVVANSSMMFATDENGGTYWPVEGVTFQHNISAWGLRPNSYGMLVSNGAAEVSAAENLFAFNRGRNPRAAMSSSPVEVVNNLVYCHGYAGAEAGNSATSAHIVGNRFKGQSDGGSCTGTPDSHVVITNSSIAYVLDNTTSGGGPAIVEVDGSSDLASEPLFVPGVTAMSSGEVEDRVFAKAGPARMILFEIDVFEHYVNGTGRIINSVDDLEGWPTLQGGANLPDSDGDGMPDWWETAHCGGSCAPTSDQDGDGYENIEEWFHSFYRDRVPVDLAVDATPVASDGNGVFEPGEQVEVAPSWRNRTPTAVSVNGTAANFGGPAGGSYTLVADDASYGSLGPGETGSCRDTGVCYRMGVGVPSVRPATHWHASFQETVPGGGTKPWTLHIGDSFTDVARSSPFYPAIEAMLHHGVTGGCGGTKYCPAGTVQRGGMAVFMLKAKEGPAYLPPACVAGQELFGDVPASDPLCRWIEELASRGVVSGCGGGDYCPSNAVTRDQMAVFLLKTLEGGSYAPPTCSGLFTDVPCPSTFANWIEELANREITGGCTATQYCPSASVTRDLMAVFVSRTFGLTLYGP
ncbi:MAG: S-layer homology domain-containing protein [Thermoanaerobaculia bacterium]